MDLGAPSRKKIKHFFRVTIIDAEGCSSDHFLMSNIEYVSDLDAGEVRVKKLS